MVKTNIQTFTGEVEVLEEFYVGSNLVANDVATHVLTVNNTANDAKIKSDFFVGDGGLLSNIATTLQAITDQGNASSNVLIFNSNTDVTGYKNVGFVTTSNVGIQNTAPTHTLSIGDKVFFSNNTNEALGESVMVVEGRINATRFQGDGGLLSNIATTLESIADQGNASSNVLIFNSNVDIPGYKGVGFVTTSNVGIQNTNPGFNTLSVGSNLFVNIYGSNVLTVHGNAAVSNLLLSEFTVSPAHGLQDVTLTGRHSTETVQLTNTTTGLEVTSNINVAGEVIITDATRGLDVTSNIELGGRLKFDTNVFVDTLRVADMAANIVTYDRTTGELLDSSGTFMNKFAVVSEQPPSDFFANTTTVTNHGTYTLTTSNLASNSNTFNAFDGTANAWVSGGLEGGYIGGSNVFHETNLTQLSNVHPTQFGDWLAIEFPYKTTLRHMKITPLTAAQFPASANVYATNNDLTWTEVKYWKDVVPASDTAVQTITVDATEQFKKYALVATKAAGNSSNVAIQDWQLFTESFSIDGGKVAMAQQAATGGETVMDQSGPHGRGVVPLKKYPEITFLSGKFVSNTSASPEIFEQGGYKVTSSASHTEDYYPWRVFDGHHIEPAGQTGWYSRNLVGNYNPSFTGSINLGTTSGGTATVNGEYLTLEMPKKICLKKYVIYGPNRETEFPQEWTFYGSNDGTEWTSIDYREGQFMKGGDDGSNNRSGEGPKSYSIVNTTYYNHYAIVVTKSAGASYRYFGFQGLELYGYEEDIPTGDTSVDTTFTSTMNTPQTTGANVYVDGSLGETFTNRVTGPTVSNTHTTYVSAGKYWELSGNVESNVTVEANTFLSGDASHSISMWFKSSNLESNTSNSCIFSLNSGEEKIDHIGSGFSNTYQKGQKIFASDGAADDRFGQGDGVNGVSMSDDGSIAVVGAFYDDTRTGAAYIFVKDANGHWNQVQKITASDAAQEDRFGCSTDISSDGTYIVVGSYLAHSTDGNNTADIGAAYVFKRTTGTNTWTQQQILNSSHASSTDQFGRRVSISGDGTYIVCNEQNADQSTSNQGAAYVFKRSGETWGTPTVLEASDGATADFFGTSVDISSDGNYIAIGAAFDNGVGTDDDGSVYIFIRTGDNTWSQQQKIDNPNVSGVDNYFGGENSGVSLSSDGTYLIVGAYGRASSNGAVFFFKRTGTSWAILAGAGLGGASNGLYTDPTTATGNLFGRAVTMSKDGTTALVHSRDNTDVTSGGAVFVYTRSGNTWTHTSVVRHKDRTSSDHFGSSLAISSDGSYFVAGMWEDDDLGGQAGAAYIYTRDNIHHLDHDLKLQANTWHNLTYAYGGHGGSRITYLDGQKVAEDQAEDTYCSYPPFRMKDYHSGGYKVSASEEYDSNYRAWEAFDYDTNTASGTGYWSTKAGGYSTSWGNDQHAFMRQGLQYVTNVGGTNYRGAWLQLEMPHKLKVDTIRWQPRAANGMPYAGIVAGSNDGVNWYSIYEFDAITNPPDISPPGKPLTPNGSVSRIGYKYVRIIITKGGGSQYVSAQSVEIFGTRENDLIHLPEPNKVRKYPHVELLDGPAKRGYRVSVSSEYAPREQRMGWMAFNNLSSSGHSTVPGGVWQNDEASNKYTPGTGVPTTNAAIFPPGGTQRGEWIKLELPFKLKVSSIYMITANAHEAVKKAILYGSNDDSNWDVVKSEFTTTLVVAPDSKRQTTEPVSTSNYYKYLVLQVTEADSTGGGSNGRSIQLYTLNYYGVREDSSIPIQIGGGNIDKVANFRVYNKFIDEDQALEIWDAQKDEFGRDKSSMTLHKGRLGLGTTEPEGRLAVEDEPTIFEPVWPPGPLQGYRTYIEGYGEFVVHRSEMESADEYRGHSWYPFDYSENTHHYTYHGERVTGTNNSFFAGPNGTYSGSKSIGGFAGDWLVLESPSPIKINDIVRMRVRSNGQCTRGFIIAGANDFNGVWTKLTEQSNLNWTSGGAHDSKTFHFENDNYYKYYAVIVTQALGVNGYPTLSTMEFSGVVKREQSVLHDGQLTLTKNLNVSRIGPPLGVDDTPRRDRLMVEYNTGTDPTFKGVVRDTSGRGFHGTMHGGIIYDDIEKALYFDGSGDYTEVKLPRNEVKGAWIHSVSCWVKSDALSGEEGIWNIGDKYGNASGAQASTSTLSFNSASPTLRWYFYSNDGSTNLHTIRDECWNHIVCVYQGGAVGGTTAVVYINGKKVLLNSFTASAALNFDMRRDRYLMLGRLAWGGGSDFHGCISNFKLYDCALKDQEVRTLYAMGRFGNVANPPPLHIAAPLYAPGTVVQVVHKHAHEYFTIVNNYGLIAPMILSIKPKFNNSKILVQMMINGEGHHDATFRVLRYIDQVFSAHMPPDAHQSPANTDGIAPMTYDVDNDSTINQTNLLFVDYPSPYSGWNDGVVEYQLYYKVQNGSTTYRFSLNQTTRDSTGNYSSDEHTVSSIVLQEIAQ